MLEVGGAPFTAPAAEMLEKNVGRAVKENDGALDELGRGAPFLAYLPGADVPGLVYVRISLCLPLSWHSGGNEPIRDHQSCLPIDRG